jgi:tetratricopeptide (TPR) repeat protein
MNTPKRNRARVLTPEGLKKLREQIRSQETEENAGTKYTLEKLGELTELDPETVKNVLDCKGSDKRTIARCFESFGLTLAESDHIPAAQAAVTPPDPNFVGREGAIADLDTLVSRNAKVIVIQARGGVGKTTLARKYLQQSFDSFLEFPIAKETKDIASIEGLIEEKLRQLGEEPGREFLVSLDRLKRKLQAERIGILIDNLEPALDSAGRFIEAHRRYVELLRVLSDPTVQSVTLITSRERLREADVTVHHYPLRSLDVTAWSQFFQSRSIQLTPFSSPGSGVGGEGALATLHNAYGGNAKAMDIISGAVLEDFAGDVEAYWQANQADLFIERDLEDLVIKQFERLQQLDPEAYNLLCRMGCYRYQDVPTVPIGGLFCLLWDVPENRHRRVIKSLQDRSLVDFEDGEYWLHPVIRAEAISRLRSNHDLILVNQAIACFWIDRFVTITTVEEAVSIFESYFHYLEICDFESACGVIIKKKQSKWEWYNLDGGETVFNAFRRLGLSRKTTLSINQILHKINNRHSLGFLYLSLAQNHLISGQLHQAIKACDQAIEVVTECINEKQYSEKVAHVSEKLSLNRNLLAALVTQAISYLDLLEFERAKEIFERVITVSRDTRQLNYEIEALFCLSFIYSSTNPEKTQELVDSAYIQIQNNSLLLSEWCIGYRFLFLGLTYKNIGKFQQSFEMYNEAISFSKESNYIQVNAKALTGLAELYRKEENLNQALSKHLEAIDILSKLQAKCDLAEAHYQLGLTYKEMAEIEKSGDNFREAIRLFDEIDASKQVERVRQSMQS